MANCRLPPLLCSPIALWIGQPSAYGNHVKVGIETHNRYDHGDTNRLFLDHAWRILDCGMCQIPSSYKNRGGDRDQQRHRAHAHHSDAVGIEGSPMTVMVSATSTLVCWMQ